MTEQQQQPQAGGGGAGGGTPGGGPGGGTPSGGQGVTTGVTVSSGGQTQTYAVNTPHEDGSIDVRVGGQDINLKQGEGVSYTERRDPLQQAQSRSGGQAAGAKSEWRIGTEANAKAGENDPTISKARQDVCKAFNRLSDADKAKVEQAALSDTSGDCSIAGAMMAAGVGNLPEHTMKQAQYESNRDHGSNWTGFPRTMTQEAKRQTALADRAYAAKSREVLHNAGERVAGAVRGLIDRAKAAYEGAIGNADRTPTPHTPAVAGLGGQGMSGPG